jgi:hypothetical protein
VAACLLLVAAHVLTLARQPSSMPASAMAHCSLQQFCSAWFLLSGCADCWEDRVSPQHAVVTPGTGMLDSRGAGVHKF